MAQATPGAEGSLCIGTFNAQFLPGVASGAGCCEDISGRADAIAQRIIASGYDAVALNQIMSEPARERLFTLLRPHYPYIVL